MTPLAPHLALAGGALLVFLSGAKSRSRRLPSALAPAAALCAGAAAILAGPATGTVGLMLDTSGMGRYFAVLAAGITFIALLFARRYARVRGFDGEEFHGLVLTATLGMVIVAQSVNWLALFLGMELLSLSFYVLVAARKGDARSAEAGLKYFVTGSVSGAFLAFGISLVYAAGGSLDIMLSLASPPELGSDPVVLLGLGLILAGIGFKLSLVPFHLWTPDVYQGAPAPVAGFLSAGSKTALAAALLRLMGASATLRGDLVPVLWGFSALTMAVGSLTALAQASLKRLLAYSSMAQMGFLLMALPALEKGGAGAAMFYLAAYAAAELGVFGTVAGLAREEDPDDLGRYRGAGYHQPWRAGLLSLCLLSLAGLPPTGGFIGKFSLFAAALRGGYAGLAVIGMLAAAVSLWYYVKIVVVLYMRPEDEAPDTPPPGLTWWIAGAAVLALLLWLGLAPGPLLDAAGKAAEELGIMV